LLTGLEDRFLKTGEPRNLTLVFDFAKPLEARRSQIADEKQTIVNLVSAELGVSFVPKMDVTNGGAWCPLCPACGIRYE
jgi:hypothetical protein